MSRDFDPLLHKLFLDHDIIFYFLDNIKKIQEKFKLSLNIFEKIMENGAFAPKRAIASFSIIFSKRVHDISKLSTGASMEQRIK